MSVDPQVPGLDFVCCQYGDHALQRVGVWKSTTSPNDASSYWLIFIHGGGWRDPRNTYRDFLPSIRQISSSPSDSREQPWRSKIAGFASIDYRLSPHPQFPQDPKETPQSELREAAHPDHILDVRSALNFLQKKHAIGSNYVLIGHSAGATLTFQLLMADDAVLHSKQDLPVVELPAAVIGTAGIYDIPGLVERHGKGYEEFISGSFSSDQEVWRSASPADYKGSFKQRWAQGRLAVLAWSPEDSLIDEPEIVSMSEKLDKDTLRPLVVKNLIGDHEEAWERGSQIARLVGLVMSELHIGS